MPLTELAPRHNGALEAWHDRPMRDTTPPNTHEEIGTTGLDDFDLDEALEVVETQREERREAVRAFLEAFGADPDEVFPEGDQ